MGLKSYLFGNETEQIPNPAFHVMAWMIHAHEFLFRRSERLKDFDIKSGTTVIDYGCGSGRYIQQAAQQVGKTGKLYAVDVHPLAIQYVTSIIKKHKLTNVTPVLAYDYDCPLPDDAADLIYVLDTFHMIETPTAFLKELHRLLKRSGTLILDEGHQSRQETKRKLGASKLWSVLEETKDHIKCTPVIAATE